MDNPKKAYDHTYHEVLRIARERAERTGKPVRIAAFYQGKWYLIDMSYPEEYAN